MGGLSCCMILFSLGRRDTPGAATAQSCVSNCIPLGFVLERGGGGKAACLRGYTSIKGCHKTSSAPCWEIQSKKSGGWRKKAIKKWFFPMPLAGFRLARCCHGKFLSASKDTHHCSSVVLAAYTYERRGEACKDRSELESQQIPALLCCFWRYAAAHKGFPLDLGLVISS